MDKYQVRSCLSGSGSITYDPDTGVIGGGGGGGVTPAALTKTDDTNVTLTLGGTPATALLQATSITVGWTGQLAVARGGTGLGALGTANQLIRVNAGATALEYFTPSYLTGLTVGTTPIASGTVGRILFEGVGNLLQENAILNLDTTNGLIIGGATARGTRQTIVNSANTYATKIFVQRNAADSADYTSIRGDGAIDFNNFSGSAQNTFLTIGGSAVLQNYFGTGNTAVSFGFANTLTYTGGAVNNIGIIGSNNFLISGTGATFNYVMGNQNVIRNCFNSLLIGQYIEISGASRTTVIGGRATTGSAKVVSGNDVTIIGYALDANPLAYTASVVTYFNNANSSHWLHENGNIGLFGKAYAIQSNTGTAPLNTYMNLTATNTLTIHNGTETSGNIGDAIQVYAKDISAGNSALHVWDEAGRIFYAGANVGMRSNHDLQLAANNVVYLTISTAGLATLADASNIAVGTTTGTKIGTATTQKLSFWNKTPIVQPTTSITGAAFVSPGAGTNVKTDDTFGGYTLQQIAAALINTGILA